MSLGLSSDPVSDKPGRRLRILIVEDIESNRDVFKLFLAELDPEIDEAENGRLAVEAFLAREYDLILMDIAMPVMDGAAAARAMRCAEVASGRRRTPIVAVSAQTLSMPERELRQIGYDLFLPKPVSKKTLLQSIEELVGGFGPRPEAPDASETDAPDLGSGFSLEPEPLVVVINPIFVHLLPKLLDAFRNMQETIGRAVEQGDKPLACRESHSLKGAALNFGVGPVAELAREIERAVKSEDRLASQERLAALREVLSRLKLTCGEKNFGD